MMERLNTFFATRLLIEQVMFCSHTRPCEPFLSILSIPCADFLSIMNVTDTFTFDKSYDMAKINKSHTNANEKTRQGTALRNYKLDRMDLVLLLV